MFIGEVLLEHGLVVALVTGLLLTLKLPVRAIAKMLRRPEFFSPPGCGRKRRQRRQLRISGAIRFSTYWLHRRYWAEKCAFFVYWRQSCGCAI